MGIFGIIRDTKWLIMDLARDARAPGLEREDSRLGAPKVSCSFIQNYPDMP